MCNKGLWGVTRKLKKSLWSITKFYQVQQKVPREKKWELVFKEDVKTLSFICACGCTSLFLSSRVASVCALFFLSSYTWIERGSYTLFRVTKKQWFLQGALGTKQNKI